MKVSSYLIFVSSKQKEKLIHWREPAAASKIFTASFIVSGLWENLDDQLELSEIVTLNICLPL